MVMMPMIMLRSIFNMFRCKRRALKKKLAKAAKTSQPKSKPEK